MTDLLLYGIAFVMGAIVSYLFIGQSMGPVERGLYQNLAQGKRVIISVDDECYIFTMIDGRVKITRGTTEFLEEIDGVERSGVANIHTDQFDNNSSSDL